MLRSLQLVARPLSCTSHTPYHIDDLLLAEGPSMPDGFYAPSSKRYVEFTCGLYISAVSVRDTY
jgi:hypothetical protein